jgi:hypothetical protein
LNSSFQSRPSRATKPHFQDSCFGHQTFQSHKDAVGGVSWKKYLRRGKFVHPGSNLFKQEPGEIILALRRLEEAELRAPA